MRLLYDTAWGEGDVKSALKEEKKNRASEVVGGG